MVIWDEEGREKRAENLEKNSMNGIKYITIDELDELADPTQAKFTLHFYNTKGLKDLNNNFNSTSGPTPKNTEKAFSFIIKGGFRVPAGQENDMVRVIETGWDQNAPSLLNLTLSPIGDYSTYTLTINNEIHKWIDPVFGSVSFKFRPGCFSLNCMPEQPAATVPEPTPVIDYLAKDYESFKHVLITAMMERVPGWKPTSEADLDQVLIELLCAAADELSDYQDRVMNEAYLATARKRVSLARHARLMDYHIHQGNQASTWLALCITVTDVKKQMEQIKLGGKAPEDLNLIVSTNGAGDDIPVIFISRGNWYLYPVLSKIELHTWSDSVSALEAGCTTADLKFDTNDYNELNDLADHIKEGEVTHFLIQEYLNPVSGEKSDADPTKRQLLELIGSGADAPKVIFDPVEGRYLLRVCWEKKDQLKSTYCFTVDCNSKKNSPVSLFHGNLVKVYHGSPITSIFKEPDSVLSDGQNYYERDLRQNRKLKTSFRLPDASLAYKNTTPGGEIPSISTLEIFEIGLHDENEKHDKSWSRDKWNQWSEEINLIHSANIINDDNHFIVETDEEGSSLVRFGDGVNGREWPENAILLCRYQVGYGPDGNIGRDTLCNADFNAFPKTIKNEYWNFLDLTTSQKKITHCWNPFDVTDGRAPEPRAEIVRRAPEIYRYRQLRAVTLKDYEKRAEELPEVSHATAKYVWTGSWRGVRVAIDPAGTEEFSQELRQKVIRHLDVVRLIGEDLEVRPPVFIPLEINVLLCVDKEHWIEAVRYELEQEFTNGVLPDGRLGFFHPDIWTFGQGLKASQILGRVHSVVGVDHVSKVSIKRSKTSGSELESIEVGANEIIQVRNDYDHMETGSIEFELTGGRQ